jgi:hypothetical protein
MTWAQYVTRIGERLGMGTNFRSENLYGRYQFGGSWSIWKYNIVTDLTKALPGNGSVNISLHETI